MIHTLGKKNKVFYYYYYYHKMKDNYDLIKSKSSLVLISDRKYHDLLKQIPKAKTYIDFFATNSGVLFS